MLLKKKKKSFERDALDEAQEILKTVNRTIESVIRDIKESNADRSVIKTGQQRIEKLKNNIDRQLNDNKQESKSIKAELSPGLLVKSTKYGLMGEIIQILNNGNDVELAAGDKRIIIPAADLVVVQTDHVKKEPAGDSYTGYTSQVLNELDIRGMSGEDAVLELAKYLDHARIARWKEIRVIHGKGTGTLHKIVHNFLKNDKHHKSFRLGNYGEGDTGVTVIEL